MRKDELIHNQWPNYTARDLKFGGYLRLIILLCAKQGFSEISRFRGLNEG